MARTTGSEALRCADNRRLFMPVSEVQAVVDELKATWKDGPKIRVVTPSAVMPGALPAERRCALVATHPTSPLSIFVSL